MKKEKVYTEKQMDILWYINDNGGVKVPVTPRLVMQNKNFYSRIARLEFDDLTTIIRHDGMASEFTITQKGKDVLECYFGSNKPSFTNDSNLEFLDNLFSGDRLSKDEKHKLISILVS